MMSPALHPANSLALVRGVTMPWTSLQNINNSDLCSSDLGIPESRMLIALWVRALSLAYLSRSTTSTTRNPAWIIGISLGKPLVYAM